TCRSTGAAGWCVLLFDVGLAGGVVVVLACIGRTQRTGLPRAGNGGAGGGDTDAGQVAAGDGVEGQNAPVADARHHLA
ncbi:hypothetical protein CEJ63_24860, partial [Acinetobacter baumannii]